MTDPTCGIKAWKLLVTREDQKAALGLPPIAKSKSKLGRRWVPVINLSERLLIVFSKLFAVRNEAAVKFERPVLIKSSQWDSRIVLHNASAVTEQKIADAGETFTVH